MTNRESELLKRFDKNGDGRIDENERADAHETMLKDRVERQTNRLVVAGGAETLRAQLIQRFDRNQDGRLDADETAAAQKFADERASDPAAIAFRAEFMKRFDQNADGKIAGDETSAVREFLAQRAESVVASPAESSLATLRQNLLQRFDRNADARIDDTEMNGAAEALRPGLEIAAARGDRFDTNFDGRLSDEEWSLARTQVQQWLNGEGALAPANTPARLTGLADEMARRRAQSLDVTSGERLMLLSSPAEEKARLEAIHEEVMRRRRIREQVAEPPK